MKKHPLVSIIMNCHNGEKYLKKSLQSIKNQDWTSNLNFININWENTNEFKKI